MEKSSEEYEESAIIRYAGQRFQVAETRFTIFIVCTTAAHYFHQIHLSPAVPYNINACLPQ
jgi:hypothetical protein